MGSFFGAIFGLYFIIAMACWPVFWAKKTDRSQVPIVRRGIGLLYGLAWPYMIVKYFTGQQQRQADQQEHWAAERRIIGGEAPAAADVPSVVPAQPRIQNPFDNN